MAASVNSVAVLAARIARAYGSLHPNACASLATELGAIERAQRRHAERCCSGEDGGYVRMRHGVSQDAIAVTRTIEHDPEAEERAGQRVVRSGLRWRERLNTLLGEADARRRPTLAHPSAKPLPVTWLQFQGDPRGAVLLIRLPGETEARAV